VERRHVGTGRAGWHAAGLRAIARFGCIFPSSRHGYGADRIRTFVHVTLPLTKTGIIAGIVLVFVPSLGVAILVLLLGLGVAANLAFSTGPFG